MTSDLNNDILVELNRKMDELLDMYKKTKAYLGFQTYDSKGANLLFTAPIYYNTGVRVLSVRLDSTIDNYSLCETETPELGKQIGYFIPVSQIHQITLNDIKTNNSITLWINQNFVVRLCSLLDSYNIWGNNRIIDKSFRGSEAINLIRALRQNFAHGSGKFNDEKKEHKKIYERIITYCSLSQSDIEYWKKYHPFDFPLSIDKVIQPLFDGCKEYLNALKQP